MCTLAMTALISFGAMAADTLSKNGAAFYQNGSFASNGYCVALAEGRYTTSQLNAAGIQDNDVTGIKVVPGFKVICYDGDNFSGDKIEVTADCENVNSIKSDFNDKTSSLEIVKVGPRVSTAYQDADYGGYSVELAEGEFDKQKMEWAGIKDQDITSMKVKPGFKMICYKDDNFSGDMVEITADCKSIGTDHNGWNDQITSFKVVPNGVTGLNTQLVRLKNEESSFFLNTIGNMTERGRHACQSKESKETTHNWILHEVSGTPGVYNIRAWNDRALGLDCIGAGTSEGTKLQLENISDGNTYQQFILYKKPDGQYQVVSRSSALVLDVPSSSHNDGIELQLWTNNGSKAQQWTLETPTLTEVYLVGGAVGVDWNVNNSLSPQKLANGKFLFKNVTFNPSEGYAGFHFLSKKDWDYPRYLCDKPGGNSVVLDANNHKASCGSYVPTGNERNFDVTQGSYDITLDINTLEVSITAAQPAEINSLYIVGNVNGNEGGTGWVSNSGSRSGNVYVFTGVTIKGNGNDDRQFHFLVNGQWNWEDRLTPDFYGGQDMKLTPGVPANYTHIASSFKPSEGREPTYSLNDGLYNIYVDLDARTVYAEKFVKLENVESVSLLGHVLSNSYSGKNFSNGWNPDQAYPGKKVSDNVFKFSNIGVQNGDNERGWFRFLVNGKVLNVVPTVHDTDYAFNLDGDLTTPFLTTDATENLKSFSTPCGFYDMTVNFNDYTVTLEPKSGNFFDGTLYLHLWEGPAFEKLKEHRDNSGFYYFNYRGENDKYFVFELPTVLNDQEKIDAVKYASQVDLKANVTMLTNSTWNADSKSFTNVKTNFSDTKATPEAVFNARNENLLIQVDQKSWCANSRMEVRLTPRAFFFYIDKSAFDLSTDDNGNKTYTVKSDWRSANGDNVRPYKIMVSNKLTPEEYPADDVPLNSDTYSLTLTGGTVYEALRGTQTGAVTIPFTRHDMAEQGYYINLGRNISTKDAESFTFNVNGHAYTGENLHLNDSRDFVVDENKFAANSPKFNRILLVVRDSDKEHGKMYDKYDLYLIDDTETGPAEFHAYEQNPMLKVWTGESNAKWSELYDSNVDTKDVDGTVKYYEFKPVPFEGKNQHMLYYLDLSNGGQGVKIRSIKDGLYAQFNILDPNGYDISTPYHGSQLFYANKWWCANPNMLVGEGSADGFANYDGKHFYNIRETSSRVDLSWDEDATIYGITLFKIMGKGYDVYAGEVIERPMYYLYATTDANRGYEKSTPLMLAVKEGANISSSQSDFEQNTTASSASKFNLMLTGNVNEYKEEGKYTGADNTLPNCYVRNKNVRKFSFRKSDKVISGNDDLNYLPADNVRFNAMGSDQDWLEIVDVTGMQRWSSAGTADKLRPNIWSNYYASQSSEQGIFLNNTSKDAEYFKLVLAANSDQLRYQAMSHTPSLTVENHLAYRKHSEGNSDQTLIYPHTSVTGNFIWNKNIAADSKITVGLDFYDRSASNTVGSRDNIMTFDKTFAESHKDASASEDAFLEDGEFFFNVPLGDFFVNCDWEMAGNVTVKNNSGAAEKNYTTGRNILGDWHAVKADALAHNEESKAYVVAWSYGADFNWHNYEEIAYPELPRTYAIYAWDATAYGDELPADKAQSYVVLHDSDKTADVNEAGHNYNTVPVELRNFQTRLEKDGVNEAKMGVQLQSVFHYCVPGEVSKVKAYEALSDADYVYNPAETSASGAPRRARSEKYADFTVKSIATDPATTFVTFDKENVTGVDSVLGDDTDSEAIYFNLQGVRVINPEPGQILIRKQGSKVEKVIVR